MQTHLSLQGCVITDHNGWMHYSCKTFSYLTLSVLGHFMVIPLFVVPNKGHHKQIFFNCICHTLLLAVES
jgi:hypothetical protein